MLALYEINLTNTTVTWFNQWSVDMQINGWEIVVNDGKFYMQRKIII